MILFSGSACDTLLAPRWWKVLGNETGRLLRYRNPRIVGAEALSEQQMQRVNMQYRGKHHATDVLSFSADESVARSVGEPLDMGDLFLCSAYAKREAHRRGISHEEELARLVIHGVLHLAGYDHATVREEGVMFKKQESCLERVLLLLRV